VTVLLRLRGGGEDVPEQDWHLLSLARAMVGECERGGLAMATNSAVKLAPATLEATQGQILSQSSTYATRFWWHLHGS